MNKKITRLSWFFAIGIVACSDEKFVSGARGPTEPSENEIVKNVVFDSTVNVSAEHDESLSLNSEGFVELKMQTQMNAPTTSNFMQVDREKVQDSFTQGNVGTSHEQKFALRDARLLDLLIVVDDSNSMSAEQAKLMNNLDSLISDINDTDWQIGIVTTTSSCLRRGATGRGVIKKSDADQVTAFRGGINAGIAGSSIERGVLNAIKGLKGECTGETTTPWIRKGSSVGVMILSDEDNCGTDGCPGEFGSKPEDLLDFLTTLKAGGTIREARGYGIFWTPGTVCATAAQEATQYKFIADQTGGAYGSICDNDYTQTLKRISQNVSEIIHREFFLDMPPDAGSVQIIADGVPITTGYTITNNKIELTSIPAGAELVIKYFTGGVEKLKKFTLSKAAASNTVEVKVNGKSMSAADATYDPASHQVVFVKEPEDRAMIGVSYRVDTPLLTDVTLSGDIINSSVKVLDEQGKEIKDYTFNPVTKKVVFNPPPEDGKKLAVQYNIEDDIITEYPMSIDPTTVYEFEVVDSNTGVEIPYTYDPSTGDITFAKADVSTPRKVTMRYLEDPPTSSYEVALTHQPKDGSLDIKASGDDNACLDQSQMTPEQKLVIPCSSIDVPALEISYKWLEPIQTEFHAPVQNLTTTQRLHVFIDGAETLDFEVDGDTIKVPPELLGPTSVVRIMIEEEYTVIVKKKTS